MRRLDALAARGCADSTRFGPQDAPTRRTSAVLSVVSGRMLLMQPVTGEDGVVRCLWAGGPGPMRAYHDEEWGVPVEGEAAYLERLTLEAFQSGLSWSTILAKRPAFRTAFCDFDGEAIAAFTDDDHARLMQDTGIVRNRLKISATITNARATVALREAEGLEALILSHAPTTPVDHTATTSPESVALSKALKKRGFVFVGPTTMYALMQAVGLVDDHIQGCWLAAPRP
jgi:DNA-3-methyladenine glycosylase I